MLNGILGAMILDVTRGLTKLHNGLHNLYSAPNILSMTISRKRRWVGHLVCMRGMTNGLKIFVQKPRNTKFTSKT